MAKNYQQPEILTRYELRKAPNSLVERLEGEITEGKKHFVIQLNEGKHVRLLAPEKIEVYSSIG